MQHLKNIGADHLTVTWKVTDKIYQHIDVKETGKENEFSLGSRLWIGNEEFEDLDEIIARHVNPMSSNVRDILNFKYYIETNGKITKFNIIIFRLVFLCNLLCRFKR